MNKDRIQFDLDFLKNLFFFVSTAFCAIVGYAIANFETLTKAQMLLGLIVVFVLVITLFLTIIGLLISRKNLEALK